MIKISEIRKHILLRHCKAMYLNEDTIVSWIKSHGILLYPKNNSLAEVPKVLIDVQGFTKDQYPLYEIELKKGMILIIRGLNIDYVYQVSEIPVEHPVPFKHPQNIPHVKGV